ncbi:DUF1289 domain-containing protein [Pseudogulbenkiania sp. MAI-1]|uniref:DUF1289 domain-containing protein n=1 Tax=Pseudogulbenkiania sp. MAI-1 TaxID=990370 RepID=UPI0009FCABF4
MAIKSPCIDLCKFDGKTGFCHGCLRTREECREWRKMKDYRRHQILQDMERRKDKLSKKVKP